MLLTCVVGLEGGSFAGNKGTRPMNKQGYAFFIVTVVTLGLSSVIDAREHREGAHSARSFTEPRAARRSLDQRDGRRQFSDMHNRSIRRGQHSPREHNRRHAPMDRTITHTDHGTRNRNRSHRGFAWIYHDRRHFSRPVKRRHHPIHRFGPQRYSVHRFGPKPYRSHRRHRAHRHFHWYR